MSESAGGPDVQRLAQIIHDSSRIVFFGGAGVSTESGIPDFRSAAGLYTTHAGDRLPPEYVLSHTCFVSDPQSFFDFHRTYLMHPEAEPNLAHRALARLEDAGKLSAVVTQNVDGLHQLAGSRVVHELHGSVHRNHCLGCGKTYAWDIVLNDTGVPRCPECGGIVRPDVVLYEEPLDGDVVDAAIEAILGADALIVAGTSLNVYPAAGLIQYYRGHRLVLINKTPTAYDRDADLVIHEALGPVLDAATERALADRG